MQVLQRKIQVNCCNNTSLLYFSSFLLRFYFALKINELELYLKKSLLYVNDSHLNGVFFLLVVKNSLRTIYKLNAVDFYCVMSDTSNLLVLCILTMNRLLFFVRIDINHSDLRKFAEICNFHMNFNFQRKFQF